MLQIDLLTLIMFAILLLSVGFSKKNISFAYVATYVAT
jgi:hypothetical protein